MRAVVLWGICILQAFAVSVESETVAPIKYENSKILWENDKLECLNSVDNNLESDLSLGIGMDFQKLKIRNIAATVAIQQTAPQEWSYMIGGTNSMDTAEIDIALGMELSKMLNKKMQNTGIIKTIANWAINWVSKLRLRIRARWWGTMTLWNDEVVHYASPSSVLRITPMYDAGSDLDARMGAPESKPVGRLSTWANRLFSWFNKGEAKMWGERDEMGFGLILGKLLGFAMPAGGMLDDMVQMLLRAAVEESLRNQMPQFLHACEIPFLCSEALDGKLELSFKMDGHYKARVVPKKGDTASKASLMQAHAEAEERFAYETAWTKDPAASEAALLFLESSDPSFLQNDPFDTAERAKNDAVDRAIDVVDSAEDALRNVTNKVTKIANNFVSMLEDDQLARWPDHSSPLNFGIGIKATGSLVGPGIVDDLKRVGWGGPGVRQLLSSMLSKTANVADFNMRGRLAEDELVMEIGHPVAPYKGSNVPLWSVWTRSGGAGLGAPSKMTWFKSFFQQKGIPAASTAVIKSVRCEGIWWGLPLTAPGDKGCVLLEQRKEVTADTPKWRDVLQFSTYANAPGQYRVRVKYEAGSPTTFLVGTVNDVAELFIEETLSETAAKLKKPSAYATYEEEARHWQAYRSYFGASEERMALLDNPPADAPKPFVHPKPVIGVREVEISLKHGSNVVTIFPSEPLGPGKGVRIHGITVEPVRGSADVERLMRSNPDGKIGGFAFDLPVPFKHLWEPVRGFLRGLLTNNSEKEAFLFTRVVREWIHLRRLLGVHSQASIVKEEDKAALMKSLFHADFASLFSTVSAFDDEEGHISTEDDEDDSSESFEAAAALEKAEAKRRKKNKLKFLEIKVEKLPFRAILQHLRPALDVAKVSFALRLKNGKAISENVSADNVGLRANLNGAVPFILSSANIRTDVVVNAARGEDMTVRSPELAEWLDTAKSGYDFRKEGMLARLSEQVKPELVTPEQEAALRDLFPVSGTTRLKETKSFLQVGEGEDSGDGIPISFAESASAELAREREEGVQRLTAALKHRRQASTRLLEPMSAEEAASIRTELQRLGLLVSPPLGPESSDDRIDGGHVAYKDGVLYPDVGENGSTSASSQYVSQPLNGNSPLIEEIRRGDIGIDPDAFNGLSFRSQLQFLRTLAGVRIDETDPHYMAPLAYEKSLNPIVEEILTSVDAKLGFQVLPFNLRMFTQKLKDVADANDRPMNPYLKSYGKPEDIIEPLVVALGLRTFEQSAAATARAKLNERAKLAQMSLFSVPQSNEKTTDAFSVRGIDWYEGPLPFSWAAPAATWKTPLRGLLGDLKFSMNLAAQTVKRLPATPNPAFTLGQAGAGTGRGAINGEFSFLAEGSIASQHKLFSLLSAKMSPAAKRLVRQRVFASYLDPKTNEVRPVLLQFRCGRLTVHDMSTASFGLAEALAHREPWLKLLADMAARSTDESILSAAKANRTGSPASPASQFLARLRAQANLPEDSIVDLMEALGLQDDSLALSLFVQALEYLQTSATAEDGAAGVLLAEAEDIMEEMLVTSVLIHERPELFIPTTKEQAGKYLREREEARTILRAAVGVLAQPPEVASIAVEDILPPMLPSLHQLTNQEAAARVEGAQVPVPIPTLQLPGVQGLLVFRPSTYHLLREGIFLQKRRLESLLAVSDEQWAQLKTAAKAEKKAKKEAKKEERKMRKLKKHEEEMQAIKNKKYLDKLFAFLEAVEDAEEQEQEVLA